MKVLINNFIFVFTVKINQDLFVLKTNFLNTITNVDIKQNLIIQLIIPWFIHKTLFLLNFNPLKMVLIHHDIEKYIGTIILASFLKMLFNVDQ